MGQRPSDEPIDTDALVEGCRRGDPQAFTALVRHYQDAVVATCVRFLHDRQEAEDVAQEVFLEVYRSLARFRGRSRLSTWIYRIAVNRCLDVVRRQRRRERLAPVRRWFGRDERGDPVEPSADTLVSPEVGPDRQAEIHEQREVLARGLARLPESQRVALTLYKLQQLNAAEVAEIMGTSVSAVEALAHRGRKRLEKWLRHYYHEDVPE